MAAEDFVAADSAVGQPLLALEFWVLALRQVLQTPTPVAAITKTIHGDAGGNAGRCTTAMAIILAADGYVFANKHGVVNFLPKWSGHPGHFFFAIANGLEIQMKIGSLTMNVSNICQAFKKRTNI